MSARGSQVRQQLFIDREVRALDDSETLTYLHRAISPHRHRVRVPATPMYLDALLADTPLTGGLEPMLGDDYLRTLTILGFPSISRPGIFDALNSQDFAYRWTTRFIALDKADATAALTKLRRQWFNKRKSLSALLREVSRVTPYVVEVDRLGEARSVAPAAADYNPTDPQIAWALGRFIANVRGISLDPVLMRENWLAAYDFAGERGALFLNEYARSSDPFAQVGTRSVSVEITSVVRASPRSWQVKWKERAYAHMSTKHLAPYADQLTFEVTPGNGGQPPFAVSPEGHKKGHSSGRARLKLVAGTDLSH